MKTRYIEVPRRRPVRRYRHCHCRKNVSPIADTFHTPLIRWALTSLAAFSVLARLGGWPLIAVIVLAAIAWKHR